MDLLVAVKKHPVITGAVTLLVMAALWGAYFLSTFDLNSYRSQLQDSFETRLSVPVRLGNARLRLRDAGLAVSFSDVVIGDAASPFSLEAQDLWLIFEWSALFHRELRFSKIGLAKPSIRFDPPATSPSGAPDQKPGTPLLIDFSIIEGLSIRTLEIRNGRCLINVPVQRGALLPISFSEVNTHLTNLALGETVGIDFSAVLQQPAASAVLEIDGTADLPKDFAAWASSAIDLNLDFSDIDGALVGNLLSLETRGSGLAGIADFSARFTGSAEQGLALNARLDSAKLDITAPALKKPYPLQHFQAEGVLQRKDDRYLLKNMAINLDGMQLAGESSLQHRTSPRRLDIVLTKGSLPSESLRRLLPAHPLFGSLADKRGTLRIKHGKFQAELDSPRGLQFITADSELEASIQDLTWQITPNLKADLASLRLSAEGDRWQLLDGTGTIGSTPFSLEGQVTLPAGAAPNLELSLAGTIASTELLHHLVQPGELPLTISGPLPCRAKLTGPPDHLNLDIDVQLDAVDLNYADRLLLPPEADSRLSLHGILSGQSFEIDYAHLQRKPFAGSISGNIDWSKQPAANIKGLLEITDATALRYLTPALEPLEIEGTANLEFSLQGLLPDLDQQAVLTLRDLGLSTRGITAKISQLQGRIHLTKNGFESEQMLARIGDSSISLKARVKDFADPVLLLDIQSRKIRADELIFYSDQIFLHDLDGQLKISTDRIEFSPVHVRLPDGTQATVNGWATVKPPLNVELDITSDFADIREVIGLWTLLSPENRDRQRIAKEPREQRKNPYQVTIRARVAKGDLYGMQFQEAVGTIGLRPGQLLIHPLDFKVDKGVCTAQVIVDFTGKDASLLRVSGHAEEIDAYEIYNELLKQKSILRGSMNGDFYLQGTIGTNYLQSSFGSFDIVIENGVLRQFNILSKIFSLLNVSQLLALKLPDMDSEGMPFDKISGNLQMNKGVLISDKLLVKSEAMNQSYIGKLDLVEKKVDLTLTIQPLGTVDKILSRIPVAGWLLTGKEKALITTHFSVQGDLSKPDVEILPVTSISEKTVGLIRRALGLPLKLVTDPSIIWGGDEED